MEERWEEREVTLEEACYERDQLATLCCKVREVKELRKEREALLEVRAPRPDVVVVRRSQQRVRDNPAFEPLHTRPVDEQRLLVVLVPTAQP